MAEKTLLKLDKFTGLHISKDAQTELKDGEASSMTNFKITKGYKLKRRDGYKVLREGTLRVRGIWHSSSENADMPRYGAVIGNTAYVSDTGFDSLESAGYVDGSGDVSFFPFRGKLYIADGVRIRELTKDSVKDIEPYRPTVMISTSPGGIGDMYESPNMMTGAMRQLFTPDGESAEFKLCMEDIISIDSVKFEGEEVTNYSFDSTTSVVTFSEAPSDSYPDSLEICFTVTNNEGYEKIHNCRYAISYGGDNDTQVFLWGNKNYPSMRFYSGAVDGEGSMAYFPEENSTVIGDGSEITSMVRHYDRLLIFTGSAAYYSYGEKKTDPLGREYISYPVLPLSSDKGCIVSGSGILTDNHPCTVSFGGLYKWTSTSIRDERNAVCFSERISPELTPYRLSKAKLFDRQSTKELFILCPDVVFVYNYELDVFYRYEDIQITHMAESENGELFFALSDGRICIAGGDDDGGRPIRCEWFSKYFDFGHPEIKKNIYTITLTVNPGVMTYGELTWATDTASHTGFDIKKTLTLGYRLFDFDELSFDDLSFDTSYVAKQLKTRTRIRRFSFFRIGLRSNMKGGDLHLLQLLLEGDISGK
ncbi:MAG: hypothetical protein E7665_08765 [Ruminococcaceae bacterium]|nr:hypothetical protein [Oscillospiraceae bacterium]